MKKINMLIAAFAVLAAVSAAGAEEIKMDFDGRTYNGAGNVSNPLLTEWRDGYDMPMPLIPGTEEMLPGGQPGKTCCGIPMGKFDTCMAVCPGDSNFDFARAVTPESFKTLAKYYQAQEKIKKAAVSYYVSRNELASAAAFAAKDARITAEKNDVFLVAAGRVTKINDLELAGTIIEIIRPQGDNKLIDPLTGALIIVSCMQDEACWSAVGDGVSAVSQWWNS